MANWFLKIMVQTEEPRGKSEQPSLQIIMSASGGGASARYYK